MTNRIKTSVVGVASTALALSLALPAFAASFTNVEFQNGQTTIEGTGGTTVNATFRVVVGSGEVVEYVQTDVLGDSLAPVCTSVGGELGLQQGTHDITLAIKLPPNTGTHSIAVQGSGIYGGFRADDCVGDVVGSATFSNAIRVVGSSTTTNTTSSESAPSWFAAFQAQITALIAALRPVTATPNAACTEYASLSAGLSFGSDTRPGGRVGQFQSFLMYKGFNIPLLSSNQAPYGFYGSQTNAAAMSFRAANNCN
jgi:hypothetical protein